MRFLVALVVAALVTSCAGSHAQQEQTALRAAYVSVAVAADAEELIEHGETERIIARDKAAGKTPNQIGDDVAAWRAKADKINEAIRVAFKAIAAAVGLSDTQAAAAVAAPVKTVVDGVAAMKTEATAGAGSGSGAP